MAIGSANTNSHINTESARSTRITSSTAETHSGSFLARIKNVAKQPTTVSLGMSFGSIHLFSGLVLGLGVLALAVSGTLVAGLPVFAVMAAGLMIVGAVLLGLSAYGAYHCDKNNQQIPSQTRPTIEDRDFTAGNQGARMGNSLDRALRRYHDVDISSLPGEIPPHSDTESLDRWLEDNSASQVSVVDHGYSESELVGFDYRERGERESIIMPPAQSDYQIPRAAILHRPGSDRPEAEARRPDRPRVDARRRDRAEAQRPDRQRIDAHRRDRPEAEAQRPDRPRLDPRRRLDAGQQNNAARLCQYIQGLRPVPAPLGYQPITVDQYLDMIKDPRRANEARMREDMLKYVFPDFSADGSEECYFTDLQHVNEARNSPFVINHLKYAATEFMRSYGFVFTIEPDNRGRGGLMIRDPQATKPSPLFQTWDPSQTIVARMLQSLYLLGMTNFSASIYYAISADPDFEKMGQQTSEWIKNAALGLEIQNRPMPDIDSRRV